MRFLTKKAKSPADLAVKNYVESLLTAVGIDIKKAKEWQERKHTVAFPDFLA